MLVLYNSIQHLRAVELKPCVSLIKCGWPISRVLCRERPFICALCYHNALATTRTCWGFSDPAHKGTRFLLGFAPDGACHANIVTNTAVGSYPTVSPLPVFPEKPSAVYFLLHFPSITCLVSRGALPYVARTFLQPPGFENNLESGRPHIRL